MQDWHPAQADIGRAAAPMDDPVLAGFSAALDPIDAGGRTGRTADASTVKRLLPTPAMAVGD